MHVKLALQFKFSRRNYDYLSIQRSSCTWTTTTLFFFSLQCHTSSFLSALHLTTHAPNSCGEIRIIHSLHAKNLLYSFPFHLYHIFPFLQLIFFYPLHQCFSCLISLCSLCFPFIFMNQCSCPMISGI